MKFLVVDDHALLRDALRDVLRGLRPGATVLDAGDAAQALAVLAAHPDLDLVLLDVQLPDGNGLDVLDEIGRRHPAVSVAMLSGDRDPQTMRQALERGAQGFIPKAEPARVLSGALELILAGGIYVPVAALGGAAGGGAAVGPAPAAAAPGPAPGAAPPSGPTLASLGLTGRQLDVLALLMQGRNNKLICRALGLAEPTVKQHVSAILKALGVTSRTEAVLAVNRLGWTLPPPPAGG